jgi:hypothetical protein
MFDSELYLFLTKYFHRHADGNLFFVCQYVLSAPVHFETMHNNVPRSFFSADKLCLLIRFVCRCVCFCRYGLSRYVLTRYILSADTFCCHYVSSPICLALICFVAYTFWAYALCTFYPDMFSSMYPSAQLVQRRVYENSY